MFIIALVSSILHLEKTEYYILVLYTKQNSLWTFKALHYLWNIRILMSPYHFTSYQQTLIKSLPFVRHWLQVYPEKWDSVFILRIKPSISNFVRLDEWCEEKYTALISSSAWKMPLERYKITWRKQDASYKRLYDGCCI